MSLLSRLFSKRPVDKSPPVASTPQVKEEILPELADPRRVQGVIYGALVGDALGVPYENHHRSNLPPFDQIEMRPPPSFFRSHVGVPPGVWSDDGSQFLALLTSLHCNHGLNLESFRRELLEWFIHGRHAVDNHVFDVGHQTREALMRLRERVPVLESGGKERHENGNGSLMRTGACALVFFNSTQELIERARTQSMLTHAHPLSQLCCALSAVLTAMLLRGRRKDDALDASIRLVRQCTAPDEVKWLDDIVEWRNNPPTGSGYVVDCFWSAWHALSTTDNFQDCVRSAILLGKNTDTTACVAGTWAGALYGLEGIPVRWIDQLAPYKLLDELIDKVPQKLVSS